MGRPIELSVIGENALDQELAAVADLVPAFRQIITFWRDVIGQEFESESWFPPSGPARPWKKVSAFGNTPPSISILNRSGRLLEAWSGGVGSVENLSREGATFGVSGIPYAAVHRGGSGEVFTVDAERPFEIRVTDKMRRFLAGVKEVYLRASTKVISIPRRPHATMNPKVQTGISAIIVAHIRGLGAAVA